MSKLTHLRLLYNSQGLSAAQVCYGSGCSLLDQQYIHEAHPTSNHLSKAIQPTKADRNHNFRGNCFLPCSTTVGVLHDQHLLGSAGQSLAHQSTTFRDVMCSSRYGCLIMLQITNAKQKGSMARPSMFENFPNFN